MKLLNAALLSFFSLVIGLFYFCYQNSWITISFPKNTPLSSVSSCKKISSKAEITFFFWHRERWQKEASHLLWSYDTAANVNLLLNSWLTLLDEEHIIYKKIMVQHVITAPTQDHIFISFDRNPLPEEASTHEKWMWIESLLKTVRHNCQTINKISFLVHHQPLRDDHLDFSNPWPINGFLK